MPDYAWTCQICHHTNAAELDVCSQCQGSAIQSGLGIEAAKTAYHASGQHQYQCFKCSHNRFESGEIRASSGMLSSMFELEGERFVFISCQNCRYTEFYRGDKSSVSSVLDFLV